MSEVKLIVTILLSYQFGRARLPRFSLSRKHGQYEWMWAFSNHGPRQSTIKCTETLHDINYLSYHAIPLKIFLLLSSFLPSDTESLRRVFHSDHLPRLHRHVRHHELCIWHLQGGWWLLLSQHICHHTGDAAAMWILRIHSVDREDREKGQYNRTSRGPSWVMVKGCLSF